MTSGMVGSRSGRLGWEAGGGPASGVAVLVRPDRRVVAALATDSDWGGERVVEERWFALTFCSLSSCLSQASSRATRLSGSRG